MDSDNELKKQIEEQIRQGVQKNDLVSNLIFAGFAHKDIIRCVTQLTHEGKIPQSYWEGTYKPSSPTPDYTTMEEVVTPPQQTPSWWKRNKRWAIGAIIGVALITLIAGLAWMFYINTAEVMISRALKEFAQESSFTLTIEASTNNGIHIINGVLSAQNSIPRYAIASKWYNNNGENIWSGDMVIPRQGGWYGKINTFITDDTMAMDLVERVQGEWIQFIQQPLPQELVQVDPLGNFTVAEGLSVGSGYDMVRELLRSDIISGAEKGSNNNNERTPISLQFNPALINAMGEAYKTLSGYSLPIAIIEEGEWTAWIDNDGIMRGVDVVLANPVNGINNISIELGDYRNNFAIEAPSAFITQERFVERARDAQEATQKQLEQ